jgi:hypothetical protein
MPNPRINPDRPLTGSEKQARYKQRQLDYIAALERAVTDANAPPWSQSRRTQWQQTHIATILRAQKSLHG